MEHQFWLEAWENGNTRFHLDKPNPFLVESLPHYQLPRGATILIPLCGKTLDIIYLRDQGFDVYGVELSELAIHSFFQENGISFQVEETKNFKIYRSPGITLMKGDFFKLAKNDLPKIDFVYDRAAIVALPPNMRTDYLTHLANLLPVGSKVHLNTFEMDGTYNEGPPHEVPLDEVIDKTKSSFTHQEVLRVNHEMKGERVRAHGHTHADSVISLLIKT